MRLAKLIPSFQGVKSNCDDAVKEDDILSKRIDSEEETKKELFMYAKKPEGLTRNAGIHAGGVLIVSWKD